MDTSNNPPPTADPAAEAPTLVPRDAGTSQTPTETSTPLMADPRSGSPQHRRVYRPSHRATFIGLGAVAVVLIVNAVIIGLVVRGQNTTANQPSGQVTISQSALDHLGVNQTGVGGSGVELTITPNTNFKGSIVVGGDIQAAGQLRLNGTLSSSSAKLTTINGNTAAFNQLGVSGATSLSTLTVAKDAVFSGLTRFQGAMTVSQLMTVNNSLNVSGNLSVGATLSAGTISGGTVAAISNLIIGGHVITAGNAPTVVKGLDGTSAPILGSNGTVSISGDDQAGTVAFNVGAGSSLGSPKGAVATITFHSAYQQAPHVVITPIGEVGSFYLSRTASGFTIYLSDTVSADGYAFDYIVEQ